MESLRNGSESIASTVLTGLSDLDRMEMLQFQAAWADLLPQRRQALIKRLFDHAQMHVEANYSAIFRWSLQDPDAEVRKWAIPGLWEDTDAALISPLAQILLADPVEEVRAAAAAALGCFVMWAELGEVETAHAQPARDALLASLARSDEASSVRRRALQAIAFSSDTDVRPWIQAAYEEEDDDVRAGALRAMGNSGDTMWREPVFRELGSNLASLRAEAAYAAGELEIGEAVPRLIRLLRDKDAQVREAAVTSLGHIGGRQARDALQELLSTADGYLRALARDALEEVAFNAGADLVFMADGDSDLLADDFDDDDDEFDEVDDFDEDDYDDLSDDDLDDFDDDSDFFSAEDDDEDDEWDG